MHYSSSTRTVLAQVQGVLTLRTPPTTQPRLLLTSRQQTALTVAVHRQAGLLVIPVPAHRTQGRQRAVSNEESLDVVQPPLSLQAKIMLCWAAIVLGLFGRFCWNLWQTRRMVARARPVDPHSLPVDWDDLWQRAGLRRPIRLVAGPTLASPAVSGFFQPVVILPQDLLTSVTPKQLAWILLHELAHIRRADILVAAVQKLVQIVYFFNPAAWLANWAVDQLREYACDDEALAATKTSRRDCGEGFLSIVERVSRRRALAGAPLGMFTGKTFVKRRLLRILNHHRRLRPRLTITAVVILLVVAYLFGIAGAILGYSTFAMYLKEGREVLKRSGKSDSD